MTDANPTVATDDSCGCCRPPDRTAQDRVNELLARRAAVEERLRQFQTAGVAR